MKFQNKNFIMNGAKQVASIYLPNGEIKINLSNIAPFTFKECSFTKVKTNCVLVTYMSFFGEYVCADILITMKEMGYDFLNEEALKNATIEIEKIKIITFYHELLKTKPNIFIDLTIEKKEDIPKEVKVIPPLDEDIPKEVKVIPPLDIENLICLHNELTQSVSKKYRNNTVVIGELANEIEQYFISKKFGFFGTVTPKVVIDTALNGDKLIRAITGGGIINSVGNTSDTAICVVITKNQNEIHITCGMTGNYGLLTTKSLVEAYFSLGGALVGRVASNVKDSVHIKAVFQYIDDLMNNFFKEQSSMPTNQQTLELSIPEKIKKLAELKEMGILTDEEFNQKKVELLARL